MEETPQSSMYTWIRHGLNHPFWGIACYKEPTSATNPRPGDQRLSAKTRRGAA